MFITNIRHLLDASEKMPDEMPTEAIELIGFLTLIIATTTKTPSNTLTTTEVRCFEKSCSGMIKTALRHANEIIHWYCPECDKEGLISGWQGTKWDNR
jgi:hypothetical protein